MTATNHRIVASGQVVKGDTLVVAVRALCDFTAKQGDLDLRFTPAPSAIEGMLGHRIVAMRRPAHYQREVSLSGNYKDLHVRGRADGYDASAGQLEEVKTYSGKLEAMRENHRHRHWAQLKIYGHLLCQRDGLGNIKLALVYFNIATQDETLLVESFSAAELQLYFDSQCECYLAWGRQELAHRAARNRALVLLNFPHATFRPGQRELAEAVYKSASSARCLMLQAPTGIGKTMGSIFPLLKACATQALDKVFFLAAKTPGRQLALNAFALVKLAEPDLPLRVLELVSKGKACVYPDKACHGDSCPLAKGFYDRLPAARAAAVAQASVDSGLLDRNAVRALALAYEVCPYYFSQDLLHWSDVVVGDYNYYFDVNAMLYAQTQANQWRVSVLVDEAHNLVERARKMYTAELDSAQMDEARLAAPPAIRTVLDRLRRSWLKLHQDQTESYQVYEKVPPDFGGALQQTSSAILEYVTEEPLALHPSVQSFFFAILHFSRMADVLGAHSLFDITLAQDPGQGGAVLCLRNIVPAPFLTSRFAAAHSVALFSATLGPANYYSDLLGVPEDTAWLDVDSPFSSEQLTVCLVNDVSTRFQHRRDSLMPITDLIAQQYSEAPGNYLCFVSSFEYLGQLLDLFRVRNTAIPAWGQTPGMDENARQGFLDRFTLESSGIGFAVLGGAFAEGIDLPGKRLIGAFIATLGLPQINPVNEQIRLRMDAIFGSGYDYTYLYPGLQKVVQAAGRVIRNQSDRGVVYLIDDRYPAARVRQLLPPWWQVELRKTRPHLIGQPRPRTKN